MPEPRKRFIEQTDEEWAITRRTLLAPGIYYWILMPIMLIAATVRVIIGLVGPEVANWQDWAALALLILLWTLFIRAAWQRGREEDRTTEITEDAEKEKKRIRFSGREDGADGHSGWTKVPARRSASACWISSTVFITKGP